MLRSTALVFGIAFNRVVVLVLVLIALPQIDTRFGGDAQALTLAISPAAGFLSWIVPLLAVEWWLAYRRPRGSAPARPRTDAVS
ncbi:hypothetical protein [Nocardiopsis sp. LOL_012]|uniref:hypothetical protein n=1 Tax=Nocardiopsis sp. LOL_012 TaxID=3345409 RepID=UPI003A838819